MSIQLPSVANWPQIYAPLMLALVVALVAVFFIRSAVQAWQDAVRLDRQERSLVERLLTPLARRVGPVNETERQELRLKLVRAGLRGDKAVQRFTFLRAALLILAAGVAALLHFSSLMVTVASLGLMYASLKLPDAYVSRLISIRQSRVGRALPALIDLMVLCLDVGLSIEAAFERVTSEMTSLEPLMAEEARLMLGEISAGLSFPLAIKRLAERVGLEELITLSRLINQASTLGASITQALREYSEASATKRMLALEYAGRVSAWLVMPLTLCMLPASLLVLAGPAVVMATRSMGH